jgi:hypothetical protein
MSSLIIDLQREFNQVFGSRPHIGRQAATPAEPGYNIIKSNQKSGLEVQFVISENNNRTSTTDKGYELFTTDSKGIEVWLPVRLEGLPSGVGDGGKLVLPYTVVRITAKSTIIRTPLAERRGSVKELYNIEDYIITIKGFFIDKARRLWPEQDLQALKEIHEMGKSFKISNALVSTFLGDEDNVVMTGFDLPEVEGGRNHVRPFVMNLESDSVFTLEVEE